MTVKELSTADEIVHTYVPEATAAECEQLLAHARELAEKFNALGADADANNAFPKETAELYRASGLLTALVPKKWGGWGADILTVANISRELAKGDPALALAYNMHHAELARFRVSPAMPEAAREQMMRWVSEDRRIMCGPLSEARAGVNGLADTVAVPDPAGGWRISGRKTWSTLIEAADFVSTSATITDPDGTVPTDFSERASRESSFMFPVTLPGISIEYTWDTLGMRGTGSQTVVYDNVHVPASAYAGDFRPSLAVGYDGAALLFSGVFLGLAEKAYEEARRILVKKHSGATPEGSDSEARTSPSVQYVLGRMKYELEVAVRTFERTGQLAVEGAYNHVPLLARTAVFNVSKVAVTEAAVSITDQALRLVGGQAFRRGHILERLFRDARSGVLQPLPTNAVYELLGRYELELAGPRA